MTLEKTRELLSVKAAMGDGCNRNSAKPLRAEVQRKHGQRAVDGFIEKFGLEALLGFEPGTGFTTP